MQGQQMEFKPGQRLAVIGCTKDSSSYFRQGKAVIKGYGRVIKDYGRCVLLQMAHYKECFFRQDLREV